MPKNSWSKIFTIQATIRDITLENAIVSIDEAKIVENDDNYILFP
jgi:hypothetical protein